MVAFKWIGIALIIFGFLSGGPVLVKGAEAPVLAKLSGEEKVRVSKLIEGAKKEGTLAYMTNDWVAVTDRALQSAFKKSYGLENLKINYYIGNTANVVTRIDQEVKAGKVMIDWFNVNIPSFFQALHERKALMKYCSPEFQYFEKINKKANLHGIPCYFQPCFVTTSTLMWNPKYIKEELCSWLDLLNPNYRGKIIVGDASKSPSLLESYYATRQVTGPDFFEKLAKQKPFFLVRSNDVTEKVMSGEYPIAIWGIPKRAYQVSKDVKLKICYAKEGVAVRPAMSAILAEAKHPHAAMLWTDFIYSKEGQQILTDVEGNISTREGIVLSPELAQFSPHFEKIKIIPIDWMKVSAETLEKYRQEFIKIFFSKS